MSSAERIACACVKVNASGSFAKEAISLIGWCAAKRGLSDKRRKVAYVLVDIYRLVGSFYDACTVGNHAFDFGCYLVLYGAKWWRFFEQTIICLWQVLLLPNATITAAAAAAAWLFTNKQVLLALLNTARYSCMWLFMCVSDCVFDLAVSAADVLIF